MDSMFSLMDLIILGSGAYVLYCYYLLKFKGEIKEGILLPKGTNIKKCTDKEGYISEVGNKVLLYGIAILICGGFGILETQTGLLGMWYLAVIAAFLAFTCWFTLGMKKAAEKYWPAAHKKATGKKK